MKKRICILLAGAILLIGTGPAAQAINNEWSAALGFLGGVMLANTIFYPPPPPMVAPPPYPPREVVYTAPAPIVVERPVYYSPPPTVVRETPARGHYEIRQRQEWVPGRWITESTRNGRMRQVWEPGHYRMVKVKVWVPEDEEVIVVE